MVAISSQGRKIEILSLAEKPQTPKSRFYSCWIFTANGASHDQADAAFSGVFHHFPSIK